MPKGKEMKGAKDDSCASRVTSPKLSFWSVQCIGMNLERIVSIPFFFSFSGKALYLLCNGETESK